MSQVKGAASLRRLLRRIEPAAREEMADALQAAGRRMEMRMKLEVPRRTGRLASQLSMKLARKTLRLRLGLITKAARRKGFYGYFLDQGRRAQTVIVVRKAHAHTYAAVAGPRTGKRERALAAKTKGVYALRVRAISRERYNFVFGRREDFIRNELPRFGQVLERVLQRAARGGGDD